MGKVCVKPWEHVQCAHRGTAVCNRCMHGGTQFMADKAAAQKVYNDKNAKRRAAHQR